MATGEVDRKLRSILRVLSERNEPVGARVIAQGLRLHGIELSERAVRNHLQILDERGLTICKGEPGRIITDEGRLELEKSVVSDKLGFVNAKIEGLAYGTSLNLKSGRGKIITNISLIPAKRFTESLDVMRCVFRAGYCMSDLVATAREGERLGEFETPAGMVAVATVCSVTLNGVLLRQGIPVTSRYGGLLEVRERQPYRFTELVGYHESTLDPAEIFIASKMTSINTASAEGTGTILASLREVPAVCLPELERILDQYAKRGLKGVLAIGKPGQPLLGVPVGVERVGLAVVGGLTPVAALEEVGVSTVNKAMSGLADLSDLKPVWEL
jgi:HTH-type transcriptional regulator, global nitrogen regulator NrpRI